MIDSVDKVIEALGGPAKTAELCGVGTSAVSNWAARGKISKSNLLTVRDALAARGLEASPTVFGFKAAEEARA